MTEIQLIKQNDVLVRNANRLSKAIYDISKCTCGDDVFDIDDECEYGHSAFDTSDESECFGCAEDNLLAFTCAMFDVLNARFVKNNAYSLRIINPKQYYTTTNLNQVFALDQRKYMNPNESSIWHFCDDLFSFVGFELGRDFNVLTFEEYQDYCLLKVWTYEGQFLEVAFIPNDLCFVATDLVIEDLVNSHLESLFPKFCVGDFIEDSNPSFLLKAKQISECSLLLEVKDFWITADNLGDHWYSKTTAIADVFGFEKDYSITTEGTDDHAFVKAIYSTLMSMLKEIDTSLQLDNQKALKTKCFNLLIVAILLKMQGHNFDEKTFLRTKLKHLVLPIDIIFSHANKYNEFALLHEDFAIFRITESEQSQKHLSVDHPLYNISK